jgi:hypothetical protein
MRPWRFPRGRGFFVIKFLLWVFGYTVVEAGADTVKIHLEPGERAFLSPGTPIKRETILDNRTGNVTRIDHQKPSAD